MVCWVMLYIVPPNSKMFPIGGECVTCHWSKLTKSSDASSKFLFVCVHFYAYKNFKPCKTLEVPSSCQSTKLIFYLTLREDEGWQRQ